MNDALAIHRALLGREILHEIVRLPASIAHADELPKVLGLPAERCLATRVYSCLDVLRGERFLTALIVPAGPPPATEPIRHAVGARMIRPARADVINRVTDYAAHLVAPLLLPESVRVLIDRAVVSGLREDDVVYTATGEPFTALGIRAHDLCMVAGAKPVDLNGESRPVDLSGRR